MGLMLAVKGKKARFNIFHEPGVELDLVMEIEGTCNSFCRERITNRKHGAALATVCDDIRLRRNSRFEITTIPVYYDILVDRIAVTYMPVEVGKHKLSIVCQGQHIMGSPFSVVVDDSIELQNYSADVAVVRPLINIPRNCTVIRKRVVRQTMVVNGVETPISPEPDPNKTVSRRKYGFPQQLSVSELMKEYDATGTEDAIAETHFTAGKQNENFEGKEELTATGSGDTSQNSENFEKSANRKVDINSTEDSQNISCELSGITTPLNSSFESPPKSFNCKKHCAVDLRRSSLDDLLSGCDPRSESVE
ncbi:uncharacterized protein B4U80_11934, partial [Leptotrombidium deliense]